MFVEVLVNTLRQAVCVCTVDYRYFDTSTIQKMVQSPETLAAGFAQLKKCCPMLDISKNMSFQLLEVLLERVRPLT